MSDIVKEYKVKLSIIIPCYNELATLDTILDAVKKSPYSDKEIIIVDDFSTDGTRGILQGINDDNIRVFLQEQNSPSEPSIQ